MKSKAKSIVSRGLALGALLVLIGGTALALNRWRDARSDEQHPADPFQDETRLAEISRIDVMRAGRVQLRVAELGDGATEQATFRYALTEPGSDVEDSDIRGFPDGDTKYLFNQGTSYHMRVGRRYGGAYHGEQELKRSLIKWRLPLPRLPGGRVVDARLQLWVESHHTNSPLYTIPDPGLYLYAYPVDTKWDAGQGGVHNDDFSAPAPGEVSWVDAQRDIRSWKSPGALPLSPVEASGQSPYLTGPVAVTEIASADTAITLSGDRLARFVQDRYVGGAADLSLLLKFDDTAEDRWGTETSLLSSNFGSDLDIRNRRPLLDIDLSVPAVTVVDSSWDFVLEPGNSVVFPKVLLPGDSQLVAAEVSAPRENVPPGLWVRGGGTGETGAQWRPLTPGMPLRASDWDWVQLKAVAAPHRLEFGDTFSTRITATWLSPGPRDRQAPELALVAPSGTVHRVRGVPVDSMGFWMAFTPRELGLWRYGWSFRPSPVYPPGSHRGEGLVFVGIPEDPGESLTALGDLANHLLEIADSIRGDRGGRLTQFNNFVRWAATVEQTGTPEDSLHASELLRTVRSAVSPRRFPDGDER